MTDRKDLMPRTDHGWDGHPWASRDWQEIDCYAVSCQWNANGKCSVPSLALIGQDGRCTGFVARIVEKGPSE